MDQSASRLQLERSRWGKNVIHSESRRLGASRVRPELDHSGLTCWTSSLGQTDIEVSHPDVVFYDYYGAWKTPIVNDTATYLGEPHGRATAENGLGRCC